MHTGTASYIVADFGIARALDKALEQDGEAQKTETMTPVWFTTGTPAYMAPEQGDEGAGEADHRADLYALGIVAHEMLTGTRPNAAGPGQRTLEDTRVPEQLASIVNTLLARAPNDRYPDADHLLAAFGTPAIGRSTFPRSRRRNAIVAAMALGVIGAGWYATTRFNGANRREAIPIDPRKLAVAAFDPLNESASDAQAPRIEQLVSDWLIRGLLQTQLVTVVPIGALAPTVGQVDRELSVLRAARATGSALLVRMGLAGLR